MVVVLGSDQKGGCLDIHTNNVKLATFGAAPDLLAALKLCRKELQALTFTDARITHALERAEAAIKKAEED